MDTNVSDTLLRNLDSFDPAVRLAAVKEIAREIAEGELTPTAPDNIANVHLHSFHSYSALGYSPSRLVWEARRRGLAVVGVCDFDVLDSLDEALAAGRTLGVRTTVSLETRAFASTYFDREVSSPGEPGVLYVMGMGFARMPEPASPAAAFVASLKAQSRARNVAMLKKVNPVTKPVELDYEKDVLPLTPSGNPTERHLCAAYDAKARALYPDGEARAAYWAETLGLATDKAAAMQDDPAALQTAIRSKLMKKGGPGYTQPDSGSFPAVRDVFQTVRGAGAIPCLPWLDGLSAGESNPDELLDDAVRWGVRIVNIIPERNWNIADPDMKKRKLAALEKFMNAARRRHIPVAAGTELNAPGQKFVDDFARPELAPYVTDFMEAAYLVYGHTVLEGAARMGLASDWADAAFPNDPAGANAFYTQVGRLVDPYTPPELGNIPADATPKAILDAITRMGSAGDGAGA
ncbi:MAG: hypothetical protein LIQ30_10235 [Planctomycetes bacterium]|nr:hypothetical protein [Planctomycetota bacterium]